jgi:recombination associated protein RdgC
MGFLKGTATFSRYRIVGPMPEGFNGFFDEKIRRFAFQDSWRTADEKAAGWVSIENCLDADFPYAAYAQGKYLLFSLRIDRKAIPPSLFRIRVMEAEQRHRTENGQKKLYREQREAIRDSVRLELLSKTLPVPSFFDICWSVTDRILFFSTLSDKTGGELQEMFRESFGLTLFPHTPWNTEETAPQTLASPVQELPAGVDPLTIGREFLTWLWFKSEERNGIVADADGAEEEIIFLRRMVLESGEGEYSETVICQGLHSDLKEGKEALRQGKKITAARLRVARDKDEWEFTFKADRFHFQSMKLPAIAEDEEEEENREGQILERLYLIEKAVETMDNLFRSFLGLRQSADWPGEQERVHRWISQP